MEELPLPIPPPPEDIFESGLSERAEKIWAAFFWVLMALYAGEWIALFTWVIMKG